MQDFVEVLQCPRTRQALRWASDSELVSADNSARFPFLEGSARFLPDEPTAGTVDEDPAQSIRDFYQTIGWQQDENGLFTDTKAFVDTRAVSVDFCGKCITRLGKYFRKGGQYLLDAGSGPIPQDELLSYGDRFERRICVDLSVQALSAARSKIGDRGVYLQGDLTNLPIKTGSIDALTCNHVIYQIPAESQAAAFRELWRVLKPGGVGVIVYWWPETPLAWRIERLVRLFGGKNGKHVQEAPKEVEPLPNLYHHPRSLSWFQMQHWPSRYEIDTFRVINNAFLRKYVSDDWRGRALLNALYALQVIAPGYCGKYGVMPAIIIRKD
jgi:SAM-dependent methyltransferase